MQVWEWLAKAAPGTYYFTDEIEAHFKAETGTVNAVNVA